jgi:hypothetical protein
MHIDIKTGRTAGFISSRRESYLDEYLSRLCNRCIDISNSPLFVLAFLYEQYGYNTENWRAELDSRVVKLESMTKMISLRSAEDQTAAPEVYEKLTGDLHSCNTELIYLSNVLDFEVEFGKFCEGITDVFEGLMIERGLGPFHSKRIRRELVQQLAYCVNCTRLKHNQTQTLRKRIESHIALVSQQTRIFTLLSRGRVESEIT